MIDWLVVGVIVVGKQFESLNCHDNGINVRARY